MIGYCSSGYHNPTGTKVAIKKVSNIFTNLQNTKRLLREVKLLRHFSNENVRLGLGAQYMWMIVLMGGVGIVYC